MPGKIGTFGALMFNAISNATDVVFTHGTVSDKIRNRRLFSTGSVSIGSYIIPCARLFWDTGSKQTFVYVPSYEKLDIAPLGDFSVSGIGAEEIARAYPARIELSDTIAFDDLVVGVLIGTDEADADSYESADVIVGMDIIQRGELLVSGQKRMFTFTT